MARLTSLLATLLFVSLITALPTPQGPNAAGGNAYSGTSGPANGGASAKNGGLVNILSNNGGDGGLSSSGDAEAGNYAPEIETIAKGKGKIINLTPPMKPTKPSKFGPKGGDHEGCPNCVNNVNQVENKIVHKGLLGLGVLGL